MYGRIAFLIPLGNYVERRRRSIFAHDFRTQRLVINMIQNLVHECLVAENPGTLHILVRVGRTNTVPDKPRVRPPCGTAL